MFIVDALNQSAVVTPMSRNIEGESTDDDVAPGLMVLVRPHMGNAIKP
jgi:hypothetical protein